MENTKPTVMIDMLTFRKIMYWVYKANEEVSGLGTVTYDAASKTFNIHSAMLLPQSNGPTSTDIDERAVQKAMFDLRDSQGEMRFWWHSHVNMETFWSGTDKDTIKQIGQHGWVLAMVLNKKNSVRSALYCGGQQFPIFIDDLDTRLDYGAAVQGEWDADFKKNVTDVLEEKRKSFTPPTPVTSTGWDGWIKDEKGFWVRKPMTKVIGITTANTTATESTPSDPLEHALSQNQRPVGIDKREWKKLRRLYVQAQEERAGRKYRGMKNLWTDEPMDESDFVQPYPFAQDEIAALASEGYDTSTLDYMLANGFTRDGIWKHAFEPDTLKGENYART